MSRTLKEKQLTECTSVVKKNHYIVYGLWEIEETIFVYTDSNCIQIIGL